MGRNEENKERADQFLAAALATNAAKYLRRNSPWVIGEARARGWMVLRGPYPVAATASANASADARYFLTTLNERKRVKTPVH